MRPKIPPAGCEQRACKPDFIDFTMQMSSKPNFKPKPSTPQSGGGNLSGRKPPTTEEEEETQQHIDLPTGGGRREGSWELPSPSR